MSKNDRRGGPLRPSSAPPEPAPQIEANWDDETVPGLNLDDPLNEFDRVTAIPELPSDLYVKRVMAAAEDSRVPAPGTAPPEPPSRAPVSLAPDEYFSLDSTPPLAPPPPSARNPDSTAPYAAVLPTNAQNAPTARPRQPWAPQRRRQSPCPRAARGYRANRRHSPVSSWPIWTASVACRSRHARPGSARHAIRAIRLLELSFDEPPPARAFKEPEGGAIGDMKDRYAMGDFSGALVIADSIIEANPEDLEAPRYAQSCRDVLTQMYSARLGALDQIVKVPYRTIKSAGSPSIIARASCSR